MRLFLLLSLLLLPLTSAWAQRFGYIDSDSILLQMPEYQEAQQELQRLTTQWEQEIQRQQSEIERLQRQLEAERPLLTPEMIAEREQQLQAKEEELTQYRTKMFGYDGLLFQRRRELIQPIKEKILRAAHAVAKQKKLNFIFDKASDLHMIYADNTYDFTSFVLEQLGVRDEDISLER